MQYYANYHIIQDNDEIGSHEGDVSINDEEVDISEYQEEEEGDSGRGYPTYKSINRMDLSSSHGVIYSNVDPSKWREETERVAPK